MAISKAERARVFAMFDGKCAYCGQRLPERWHVDHLEPVQRDLKMVRGERSWKYVSGAPLRPERDIPSNYMPALQHRQARDEPGSVAREASAHLQSAGRQLPHLSPCLALRLSRRNRRADRIPF